MAKFDRESVKIQDISTKPETTVKSDLEKKLVVFAKKQMDYQSQLNVLEENITVRHSLLIKELAKLAHYKKDGKYAKTVEEYDSVVKNYEKELTQELFSRAPADFRQRQKLNKLESEWTEATKKAQSYKTAKEENAREIKKLKREIEENDIEKNRISFQLRMETSAHQQWMRRHETEINNAYLQGIEEENLVKHESLKKRLKNATGDRESGPKLKRKREETNSNEKFNFNDSLDVWESKRERLRSDPNLRKEAIINSMDAKYGEDAELKRNLGGQQNLSCMCQDGCASVSFYLILVSEPYSQEQKINGKIRRISGRFYSKNIEVLFLEQNQLKIRRILSSFLAYLIYYFLGG